MNFRKLNSGAFFANGLQVTFVAEKEPPLDYLHEVELWGTTYNLYSYSFEKLGVVRVPSPLIPMLYAFYVGEEC